MRWALNRYCYDPEGKIIPAMVAALDVWPMDLFEQIQGVGAERADLAAAWQDFRYKRVQADARRQSEVDALTRRPTSHR